uniref:Uncharacterized protein n=1 Tax=Chlamydomonas leiostraca TaxID=1034604 RepID=A0A6T8T0H4_9CHLO|mmetsp:Transcript_28761/g.73227  ORF Transcript_28761/g.73227 Transcript_28761/m.73227 type:complete len:571 (+) Transcript_28761:101-1813(+)|eukprot:CAMPEP_0202860022 /NCGR_PEP_ID=MMETSP1391-20130828/1903_1 /ASSEMBLY_ACC=CAM_ASM_000867 /TAXON_ID=1034604 /ORGANISM="Chlamydomonas leiostraca, Strain SAG 11-49" /LENGTH=570 /DNA_ID=CAMNT_0049539143 /DNA_START=95 /DNA_END=1807 /DNA_ORIENTATION=-
MEMPHSTAAESFSRALLGANAIGPGNLFSSDPELDKIAWGVVFTSCGLFLLSAVSLVAGALELVGILGQVCCMRTWSAANAVLFVAWWPILGLSAWLHAPPQNVRLISVFIAVSCAVIVGHAVVLVCYWIRHVRWTRAARELPTQQLLTEAQREVALQLGLPQPPSNNSPASTRSGGPSPSRDVRASGGVDAVNPSFQLQYGCLDGGYNYTLYIPAEAEEQALVRVLREHAARQAHAHSTPSPPRAPLLGPGNGNLVVGLTRNWAARKADGEQAGSAGSRQAQPERPDIEAGSDTHTPRANMITACFGAGQDADRLPSGSSASASPGQPRNSGSSRSSGGAAAAATSSHSKSRSHGAGGPLQELLHDVAEAEQHEPMLGGFHSSGAVGSSSSSGGGAAKPGSSSTAKAADSAALPPTQSVPIGAAAPGGVPLPQVHHHAHSTSEKPSSSGSSFQLRPRKHRRSHSLPLTNAKSLHRALLPLDEREDEGQDDDDGDDGDGRAAPAPAPAAASKPSDNSLLGRASGSKLAKARLQVASLLPPQLSRGSAGGRQGDRSSQSAGGAGGGNPADA